MSRNAAEVNGLSDVQFEHWMVEERARNLATDPAGLQSVLLAIEGDQLLTTVEKQGRVHRLLTFLKVAAPVLFDAWATMAKAAPQIQGAVIANLPPRLRQQALGLTQQGVTPVHGEPTSELSQHDDKVAPRTGPDVAEEASADPPDNGFVVLIGESAEFNTTLSLLRNARFTPVVCSTVEELSDDERLRACAIVVGKSSYSRKSADEQRQILQAIVRWSSLTWVRIGTDGLAPELSGNLPQLKSSLGFSSARQEAIDFADRSELTQTDLGYIRPYGHRIAGYTNTTLVIDGRSRQQMTLVAHAVAAELRAAELDHLITDHIWVKVHSGRSGSIMMSCRVEGCNHLFMVRLGTVSTLIQGEFAELPRIKDLIVPWNADLLPSVHAIGKDAVLVYRTVRNTGSPEVLALTLADKLRLMQAGELPDPPPSVPTAQQVTASIQAAYGIIVSLNKRSQEATSTRYEFVLKHYEEMLRAGRGFMLNDQGSRIQLEELLEIAVKLVGQNMVGATVHGDPHASNVVLPSAHAAELIDFERTCIGHPLYDFCHLLVSICGTSYRAYLCIQDSAELFFKVLFGKVARADGESSAINSTVLSSLRIARSSADELCKHYKLPDHSFAAMLTVVCTMALMYLPHLSSEAIKGLLIACGRDLGV